MRLGEVEEQLKSLRISDGEVPWWKLAMLECSRKWDIKSGDGFWLWNLNRAKRPLGRAEEWIPKQRALVAESNEMFQAEMDYYIREEPDLTRRAALTSTRAFIQLIKLLDDDLLPPIMKDFHVLAVAAMRRYELAEVLLPFSHGKSWLSSIVVPLMDWAEDAEMTQLRIYQNRDWVREWTTKLMDIVEHHAGLHAVFPWIARPDPGDPCEKIWSSQGFAIKGKKVVDPSFRAFTVGSKRVGGRVDRVGCDDWVTEGNCSSAVEQQKLIRYFNTGMKTFRRARPNWWSPYGTKRGTGYLIGTIFDKRDINYRTQVDWTHKITAGEKGMKVLRIAVYPRRGSSEHGEVIWPERRPLKLIRQWEDELGREAFRMRCLNLPTLASNVRFKPGVVAQACRSEFEYGRVPDGYRALIGFDPASGKKGLCAPAAVLLAFGPDREVHFVRWEKFYTSQPNQVKQLAEWSRIYDPCPLVVESNQLQSSYKEWIREYAPDVQVNLHHTDAGKKHSKEDGVESFIPLFEAGKVTIHTGGVDKSLLRELLDEFLDWPQGSNDLVMASWFAKFHHWRRARGETMQAPAPTRPRYATMRGLTYVVDLRPYK